MNTSNLIVSVITLLASVTMVGAEEKSKTPYVEYGTGGLTLQNK